MRIAQISHGLSPLPPPVWGGVQSIVWNHKLHLEARGHQVDVYNHLRINDALYEINRGSYDFVHCQSGLFLLPCVAHLERPFAFTSQDSRWALVPADATSFEGSFEYHVRDSLKAPALLPPAGLVRDAYARLGYGGFLSVLPNGVEANVFRTSPRGTKEGICLGRVSPQLRQVELARITEGLVPVDFVGEWSPQAVPEFSAYALGRHLGNWDRTTLYERLTEYKCLVSLSDTEAAPLFVRAAMAAGLSVVVTRACSADLPVEDFVQVLPEDRPLTETLVPAIERACEVNGRCRQDIMDHAREKWDYSVVIERYLEIIDAFREHHRGVPA